MMQLNQPNQDVLLVAPYDPWTKIEVAMRYSGVSPLVVTL